MNQKIIKQRQSNIELLRNISMFMVLLLHSSFLAFGIPEANDIHGAPAIWGGRIFQQGLGIVAVDVFVLISGWFSIKPKTKRVLAFLFQIAFLKVLSFLIFLTLGEIDVNKDTITELLMLNSGQGWFIKAYLLLYILSPVLNSFSENASKGVFQKVLAFYWMFLFGLGWMVDATSYINEGYSIVSFVGLYLLARYVRIWKPNWANLTKKLDIAIYLACVFGFWGIIFGLGCLGIEKTSYVAYKFCSYVCPLTVIGALFLLLFFSKVDIGYKKWINVCGKSCFSIYLLHAMWGIWFDILHHIAANYSGFSYIVILYAFLVVVYLGCIMLDQLRIKVWNIITKTFS